MGIDIITKVLRVPCTQIANNAGKDGAQVAESLLMKDGDYGYDAREDKFVYSLCLKMNIWLKIQVCLKTFLSEFNLLKGYKNTDDNKF